MRRRCKKCKRVDECAKHRRVCKVCDYQRTQLWAKNNRSKRLASCARWRRNNPLRVLEVRLRSEYRFSEQAIQIILAWHGSTCICGKKIKKLGLGWYEGRIDHNHETGKFRGIICGRCNYVLGAVRESKKLLLRMRKYLNRGSR